MKIKYRRYNNFKRNYKTKMKPYFLRNFTRTKINFISLFFVVNAIEIIFFKNLKFIFLKK
jgi:hypothetical protein